MYQNLVARTECGYERRPFVEDLETFRILHGAIGIATEGGELLDNLKKHLFYGKALDRVNLFEELGDVMWYVATICNAAGFSLEDVQNANIEKLKARYPDKFTEKHAIMRDLDKEQHILRIWEPTTNEA